VVVRIHPKSQPPVLPGWRKVAQYNQRTRNSELVVVYRRHSGATGGAQAAPEVFDEIEDVASIELTEAD
jgi:hypothetical protein